MRIISGKYRGKILKSFEGTEIRPTSDRAKEAVFNILQSVMPVDSFLDLFCGSGSMGVEAISRGVKNVTFVDSRKESINLAKLNVASIKEQANFCLSDAKAFLNATTSKFDIIFLDPPYKYLEANEILTIISSRNLLTDSGIVIYEHGENEFKTDVLEVFSSRKYGVAHFEFLRRKQ